MLVGSPPIPAAGADHLEASSRLSNCLDCQLLSHIGGRGLKFPRWPTIIRPEKLVLACSRGLQTSAWVQPHSGCWRGCDDAHCITLFTERGASLPSRPVDLKVASLTAHGGFCQQLVRAHTISSLCSTTCDIRAQVLDHLRAARGMYASSGLMGLDVDNSQLYSN